MKVNSTKSASSACLICGSSYYCCSFYRQPGHRFGKTTTRNSPGKGSVPGPWSITVAPMAPVSSISDEPPHALPIGIDGGTQGIQKGWPALHFNPDQSEAAGPGIELKTWVLRRPGVPAGVFQVLVEVRQPIALVSVVFIVQFKLRDSNLLDTSTNQMHPNFPIPMQLMCMALLVTCDRIPKQARYGRLWHFTHLKHQNWRRRWW